MEFRILGPLEVELNGRLLALGAAKHRVVLAVLLLSANRTVSRDRLVDAVWGDEPPNTASTALQVYVSGLRKTLGAERIETVPPGYRLVAEEGSVDLERFERLVRAGSAELAAGNPLEAARLLREAQALWRGEPLADLDAVPFVASERLRLEELRMGAVEERIDADLALGQHGELVPELQQLVHDHPLRERLRGQLMLALYRSERQAEALEVYRDGRRRLVGELGLDPGETLQRLERAVLEHDPALATPRPPPEEQQPVSGPPRRRRALVPAAVAAAAAVFAIVLAVTIARSRSGGVPVQANSLAVVDPVAKRVIADVSLEATPVDVVVGFGSAWVATEDGTVLRIDPQAHEIVATVDVGTSAHDLAIGFRRVWVANGAEGVVTRIDPASDTLDSTIAFERTENAPEPVHWISRGPSSMWALRGRTLISIDGSGRVEGTFAVPAATAMTVDPSAGSVWLVTPEHRLLQFRASLGSIVGAHDLHAPAAAPSAADGEVHVIVYDVRGAVVRVGAPGAAETIGPQSEAYLLALAVADDAVWTIDAAGAVTRRDRTTGRVVAEIETAPTVRSAVAVGERAVWVAIQEPS